MSFHEILAGTARVHADRIAVKAEVAHGHLLAPAQVDAGSGGAIAAVQQHVVGIEGVARTQRGGIDGLIDQDRRLITRGVLVTDQADVVLLHDHLLGVGAGLDENGGSGLHAAVAAHRTGDRFPWSRSSARVVVMAAVHRDVVRRAALRLAFLKTRGMQGITRRPSSTLRTPVKPTPVRRRAAKTGHWSS